MDWEQSEELVKPKKEILHQTEAFTTNKHYLPHCAANFPMAAWLNMGGDYL